MKTSFTNHATNLFDRWTRFIGILLVVILMMPAITVSQKSHFKNPVSIPLLTAGNFRILGGSAVTINSGDTVTGDVGCTTVTNSGRVIGNIWATTYTGSGTLSGIVNPVGTTVSTAQADLAAAYDTAVARTADTTMAVALDKDTLGRGVYTSATFSLNDTLTLTGTASDVFIFKATGSTLITGTGCYVKLINGAVWSNVFWQVTSSATIAGGFKGIVLALTSIDQSADVASIITGRLLARNGAVTVAGHKVTLVKPAESKMSQEFSLLQNYPNPFNPTTAISFTLAKDGFTTLKIYDVLGREVATLVNGVMKAEVLNKVNFNASKLSSGVYFSRLESGGNVQMKKLVLMK
jgi:Ice-binding-like/Secretion system C-terminal sorting domain